MGNGSYEIKVMENTTGSKYRKIYGETISVALSSSLNPFLYPNQFVNYSVSSRAVKKSFDLCVNAAGEAQKVAAIYHYVTTHKMCIRDRKVNWMRSSERRLHWPD